MKIHIEATIELDAEAWAAEYGIAIADVRDDVRQHVRTILWALAVEPTSVEMKSSKRAGDSTRDRAAAAREVFWHPPVTTPPQQFWGLPVESIE